MKIYLIVLILVTSSISSNAQVTSNICGNVDYLQTQNITRTINHNYTLTFNKSESIYKEVSIESSADSNLDEQSSQGTSYTTILGRKNTDPNYFYKTPSDLFFKEIFADEPLIVKENENLFDWKLQAETRQIGNFNCNKATTIFRGRDYTAWYTPKIPVKFGPWKFNGLPGLILEIYDTDEVLHIIASKVEINDNNCEIAVNKKELSNAMTITEYLKEKDDIVDRVFATMSSKLPKGSVPLKRDKNCEDCAQGIEIFKDKK